MHHIFISYSRSDKRWVDDLASGLRAHDVTVWIDQQDIPVSLPWFQEVSDAIGAAQAFLACVSPSWRASASCQAEHEIASHCEKSMLSVAVGTPAIDAAREVVAAIRAQGLHERERVELLVLARDWDRAGRPAGALVGRRRARVLERASHVPPAVSAAERAFLRTSRRRSVRRAGIAVAAGLAVAGGLVSWAIISTLRSDVTRANAAQVVAYGRIAQLRTAGTDDPLRALSSATTLGGSESMQNAAFIEDAFSDKYADDAFTVGASARRFAEVPIGRQVVATDGERSWRRAADATDDRASSTSKRTFRRERARSDAGSVAVQVDARAGTVLVRRRGVLWRRFFLSQLINSASLSPDGRDLAVADGNSVAIADLEAGVIKQQRLWGDGDRIRDVAWSKNGSHVWALVPGRAMSWAVRPGALLRDAPTKAYEAILPSARQDAAWLVGSDGRLEELDVATGAHRRSIRIHDSVSAAGGALDGKTAAVSGRRGLWLVSLVDRSTRLILLPGCQLGRAAFSDDRHVVVPCVNGLILTFDAATGHRVGRLRNSVNGVFAVRPLPRTGTLLSSDTIGDMYATRRDGGTHMIYRSECGGTVTRIATSPAGRAVIPVGAGTGLNGCARRLLRRGGDPDDVRGWRADAFIDATPDHMAEVAAVGRQGRVFVIGYQDGEVTIRPTENLVPAVHVSTFDGAIRDLLVTDDDRLLVATDAGMFASVPLCEACVTDRAMAAEARTTLKRLLALGVAARARRSP